ncbi:MAG: hypothetical protein AAGD07_21195 [Planctomycetota bacterium]
MSATDSGLIDRLPARAEIGREIVQLDLRRRWLRSLYRLRCRIDEQSARTDSSTDAPQAANGNHGGLDE